MRMHIFLPHMDQPRNMHMFMFMHMRMFLSEARIPYRAHPCQCHFSEIFRKEYMRMPMRISMRMWIYLYIAMRMRIFMFMCILYFLNFQCIDNCVCVSTYSWTCAFNILCACICVCVYAFRYKEAAIMIAPYICICLCACVYRQVQQGSMRRNEKSLSEDRPYTLIATVFPGIPLWRSHVLWYICTSWFSLHRLSCKLLLP